MTAQAETETSSDGIGVEVSLRLERGAVVFIALDGTALEADLTPAQALHMAHALISCARVTIEDVKGVFAGLSDTPFPEDAFRDFVTAVSA